MRRARRQAIGLVLVAGTPFLVGFLWFAETVTRPPVAPRGADGIVVLTGGHQRITEAGRLLADGRGRRLLVSGVNRHTTGEEIRRLAALEPRLFECCVDLGYEALDTAGNAEEAGAWAAAHRYTSLIVVTSDYHMPRSMAELARVMPGVGLIPHPVRTRQLGEDGWWTSAGALRILAPEYLKFLPSAARLAAARVLRCLDRLAAGARGAPRH